MSKILAPFTSFPLYDSKTFVFLIFITEMQFIADVLDKHFHCIVTKLRNCHNYNFTFILNTV